MKKSELKELIKEVLNEAYAVTPETKKIVKEFSHELMHTGFYNVEMISVASSKFAEMVRLDSNKIKSYGKLISAERALEEAIKNFDDDIKEFYGVK